MDIPSFIEWAKDVERDDLTADDFNLKVTWFDKDCDFARLTMLPYAEGDLIEALVEPVTLLTAAQVNAGHLAVVSDGCKPLTPTKPNGTPWLPGEPLAALRLGLTDLVQEALFITVVGADGIIVDASTNYHRNPDGPVDYDTTKVDLFESGDPRCEGRLAWLLQTAIGAPKVHPGLIDQFGRSPFPEGQEDMHMLAIAVKIVMRKTGWNCMIGSADEEEREAVRACLSNGPLTDGLVLYDNEQISEIVELERTWSQS